MDTTLLLTLVYYTSFVSIAHMKDLEDILSFYNTLNKVDIHHNIVRRGLQNQHDRHIAFSSHGRKFHMNLVQSRDIFSPSFSAVSVDRFGNEEPFTVNMNSYYKGYIEEDDTSDVTAHVDDDGMMTATIDTANETYIVEPMWRHVDNDPTNDMIVYKASDVKSNLTNSNHNKSGVPHVNICGNNINAHDGDYDQGNIDSKGRNIDKTEDNSEINQRFRRDTSCEEVTSNNTCNLILVADYSFFDKMGRKNKATAAYYMFHTILRVDRIFRKTCWDRVGSNIGVQVKKTKIHYEQTLPRHKPRFNQKKKDGWTVNELLTDFSRENWRDYCLAHLFTYKDFPNGVIGLAYISKKSRPYGGICSPKNIESATYENCALTTYVNWERSLTTLEADIVTAHEIGHNFGSHHDKESCSPDDGKYIMYETSVSGKQDNNKIFSRCSRKQIGGVLEKRRKNCFTSKDNNKCGNSEIDKGEECDQGIITDDKCCDDKCQLTAGSNCSDYNSLCCKNCKIASNQTVCMESSTIECKGKINCDGISKNCPKEAPKLNDKECINKSSTGICRDGKCLSYCSLEKTHGSCTCEGNDACKVCCNKSNVCMPVVYENKTVNETHGMLCNVPQGEGLCVSGKCQLIQTDVRKKFPSLSDLSLHQAILLMENNIVLTILIFSLILWIPASCIVNYVDREEDEIMSIKREISMEGNNTLRIKKHSGGFQNVISGQHLGTNVGL